MIGYRRVDQYRPIGTRNFVRVEDLVEARPPVGAPFLAKVRRIEIPTGAREEGISADVVVVDLTVVSKLNGRTHPRAGSTRVLFGTAITRRARSRSVTG